MVAKANYPNVEGRFRFDKPAASCLVTTEILLLDVVRARDRRRVGTRGSGLYFVGSDHGRLCVEMVCAEV